jgi:hypothetical protein
MISLSIVKMCDFVFLFFWSALQGAWSGCGQLEKDVTGGAKGRGSFEEDRYYSQPNFTTEGF